VTLITVRVPISCDIGRISVNDVGAPSSISSLLSRKMRDTHSQFENWKGLGLHTSAGQLAAWFSG